jgi:mannose-6-phosphate isomerase-like protein (cupin superfamily)
VADFVIRRWELVPYSGEQAPPHVHFGSDEGFCVLKGRLEVRFGGQRTLLGPGEHLIVPAGTTHTFATVGGQSATLLAVLTPEVDALVEALHTVPPHDRDALWARYNSAVVAL